MENATFRFFRVKPERYCAREMSRENVEKIRRWADGVLTGDVADLGDLSFLDPEVVYEDEILLDHFGEAYHGHDGFRKAWSRAIEPWQAIEGHVEWVRETGDDVVSCHYGRLHGRGSGIETEIRFAYLWRFREGKVVYCKSYLEPAKALKAAGLRE